jgi:hypothetical protein
VKAKEDSETVHGMNDAGLPACGGRYIMERLTPTDEPINCRKAVCLAMAGDADELLAEQSFSVILEYGATAIIVPDVKATDAESAADAAIELLSVTVETVTRTVLR